MTRTMEMRSCKPLPGDLEIEILSRLPVKSLLRFKCICKSWYVSIKSPRFINKHLRLSQNSSCLLLLRARRDTYKYLATLLSSGTIGVSAEMEFPNLKSAKIIGSCNGLVSICDYFYDYRTIHILNPATREVIKPIPVPPYETCQPHVSPETTFFAFGFDPKINDYKLVRINRLVAESGELPSVVQICTLRSPSWRDTELVVPAHISANGQINTYINGTFNWLARDSEGSINTILSFHMSNEVFETTKIPDFLLKNHWGQLAVLNGSLALIRYPKRGGRPRTSMYYEIWATNQSRLEEEEAWVRKVAVGPIAGVVETPLAILGIDILFLASSEGELISCDLRTQEIRKHQVFGVEQRMQVGIYNESLISVE
ncbi:hypothetical protein RHGRI_028445 [Rhododendron griersonianum]|uniref:F-box domain-containing protein n=1 Tax=Rhododendron griersonianum TaxID=479676 RepID=A0AAV6II81_9ERIC|nr:hypothetical protein RHGRI_028445 [Rhododendron griersonianum]